eukprot:7885963-Karenia_brevis.AAC.1
MPRRSALVDEEVKPSRYANNSIPSEHSLDKENSFSIGLKLKASTSLPGCQIPEDARPYTGV